MSSFSNYRKQPDVRDSDSDIEDESSESDNDFTKEASFIESSFVLEDAQNPLVKAQLGRTFTGNHNKELDSRYVSKQGIEAVPETSSDDDEEDEKDLSSKSNEERNESLVDVKKDSKYSKRKDASSEEDVSLEESSDESTGNEGPNESLVDLKKKSNKYSKRKDASSEEDVSQEESSDESLVYRRQKNKKHNIISSGSESDDTKHSLLKLKQQSDKLESKVKPIIIDSDESEDEVMPTPARKSKGRTSVNGSARDSKEAYKDTKATVNMNSSQVLVIESDDSFSPDADSPLLVSGSENSELIPPLINNREVDYQKVSLISSDSEESNDKITKLPTRVPELTKHDNKPTEKAIKLIDPPTQHQSNDLSDKVIDLTLIDYPSKGREPVPTFFPSGGSNWLSTKKDNTPSTVKTETKPPLKPTAQLNDHANMVFMAEFQMLETNIRLKKKDLQKTNDILMQINVNTLPDKGKKLQMRSAILNKEVKELEEQKSQLQSKVSRNHMLDPAELAKAQTKPQVPSWKDIRKTSDVEHGYGVKAMENYHAEKAATLEVLKHLHNSLKTRPDATTFAADPQELQSGVKLMPHQKHALAWMMWRESEKPSGGILADDMGLGKTLTMISLVLKCAEENIVRTCSDSDPDDDRKENKSYHQSRYNNIDGGTLVVCPASLLSQWEGEVKRRVNRGVIGVELHHGSNRETKPHRLARNKMVVTTYAIVMNEHSRRGPLHQVKWQRIILDEAHTVRNYKSLTSIAVVDLKAHCRWALTGTPIHNKELDMFALLKFLRCSPFDDLPVWRKWVDNKREGGMTRLNTVMNSIMLRRTKEQLQQEKSFDCLPTKNVEDIEVKLDSDEFAVYEKVLIFSRGLMAEFLHQKAEKEAVQSGHAYTPLNFRNLKPEENPFGANTKLGSMHQKMNSIQDVKSYHILVLLLRLRQICCHPGLIKKMLDQESAEQDGIEDKDGLDMDLVAQINKMSLSEQRGPDFDPDNALSEEDILKPSNPVFNTERASSKMRAVFTCIENNIKGTQDKAVIVSQWPSMLLLMGSHLKEMQIRTSILTGAVPVKDRAKIVDDFNKVGRGPQVLLLSLTAGGVGLNLVGGNHLLLCDLHWNPQLEAQACDRIYRMGQKKTVHIYKFVCEDTIEQKIKNIQGKKLAIASSILTGAHKTQANKLTLDDLKTIFNL